jgi:multidrug efflux pump subunit AcrB
VTASVGGESEDIEEGFRNLFLSIVVSLAPVYLILIVFFGALSLPLILLAVPLTTVGAFGYTFTDERSIGEPLRPFVLGFGPRRWR